ncbi:hypothetical protein AVDCRST_MAG94-1268 [uncultured Leptolyngbya sp.]|uniref:Uncharacterized protein n=1 Tax=uncultured Leptolyngbya sp. TaxID=332963 RepID=A0A6J4KVX8_9CYAN|nr:hypothetical protein AVDCRST_MAG94-1268 [uncultured Leptolyngbya sp.]
MEFCFSSDFCNTTLNSVKPKKVFPVFEETLQVLEQLLPLLQRLISSR